ncbi:MAG: acetylglutamate kinase [Gemmatimonadaceae bacterium]
MRRRTPRGGARAVHPTAPIVVKVGGRAQGDPALPARLAALWRTSGRALVLVHGGGDEISTLQRALGAEPSFVGGRRVTTEGDIATVRMALSGAINKRIVAALISRGVEAVGLSGEDAALIGARRMTTDGGGSLGLVGAPERINAALLRHLLAGGYMPVVSPLGRDLDGGGSALNVNGDDAAAAIATAIGARELFFLADVAGVLVDGTPVEGLDADDVATLIAGGTAAGGMAAKLQAAVGALHGGVPSVRIGDLSALGDVARGTTVTLSRSLV